MELDDQSPIDIICTNGGSQYFDEVIGHIEDIVLSTEFETMHQNFMETYWQCIEDTEENKLEYMDIFNEYTTIFENFFVGELNKRMKDFDMRRFAKEFEENNSYVGSLENGEIFELLNSFTNFITFKELLLDYRYKKEGNVEHLNFDILTTKPLCPDSLGDHQEFSYRQKHNI